MLTPAEVRVQIVLLCVPIPQGPAMSRAELPAAFESGMTMALDVHAVLADLAAPLLEAKLLQPELGLGQ